MLKKSVLWIGVYLLAVAVVIVAVYMGVSWYTGKPLPVPGLSSLPFLPKPTLPASQFTGVSGVEKVVFDSGRIFFFINGHFISRLAYDSAGTNLQGDFVIDGEPSKRKIPVVIANIGKSQINFGSKRSSDNSLEFRLVPIGLVKDSVAPGSQVQLRVEINPQTEAQLLSVLDGMASGNWDMPVNFLLAPLMLVVMD